MMDDIKKLTFTVSIIFLCGILTGWFYGTHIINRLMRGEPGVSTFVFMPTKNLIDTYIMLNSRNELIRLEGYYSYRETGLRDFDFLYIRYKLENSEIIKKTIIWIAEENAPEEKINFYKKLYDVSSQTLKRYLQAKIDSFELIHNNKIQSPGEK